MASKITNLARTLAKQGRTVTWLAETTGYSRGYVSNVLHGRAPMSEEFHRKALDAFGADALLPVTYRGRLVHIPASIYHAANDLPDLVIEDAYEDAWKRSWLKEHGATALATAVERAWAAHAPRPA